MPEKKDLQGQVFGRLVVIAEAGRTKTGSVNWLCQCACGNQTTVRAYDLVKVTRSCGCLHREIIGKQFSKHGQSRTKVYAAWTSITDRCDNPNNKDFYHYGGRGIQVCERWRDSFEAFLLDMGQPPSSKHSIDRIQVDGNYEPSNCRWATQKEQTRNMRKSHMLTWDGKTQCISAWAEELNVPRHLFHSRLKLGWSTEKIFQRIFQDKRNISANKPVLDLEDWHQTISGTQDNSEEKLALIEQVGELTRSLGWSSDRAQGYLKQNYGVTGRKQMSVKQLRQVIEKLTPVPVP